MRLFKGVHALHSTEGFRLEKTVVAIGNFDGVHLGHQAIFKETINQARQLGAKTVAYTFRPHPQLALRPEANLTLLMSYDEKLEGLSQVGLDYVIEEPFSREFSTTPPERFFSDILVRGLNAKAIVVGYDFSFGKGREGSLDALREFCAKDNVGLTVVSPQRIQEMVVSSSVIRERLRDGDVELSAQLMGREFCYRGIVQKGDGRGRLLGFPTANLRCEEKVILPNGVYATRTKIGDRLLPSVTNLGVRPTFQVGDKILPLLVETHILDETLDLYGTPIEVRFVKKLRDERKFDGVESLKAQISRDLVDARKVLKT